ncbi:MAG: GntR family transcriptional regulator [Sphingorhabdus sp.]
MSPGKVTDRSYRLIKNAIASGELRLGDRLDSTMLARKYESSPTPIRDALFRLTGERLVDPQPNCGFKLSIPSEVQLRSRYDWSLKLLKQVAKGPKRNPRECWDVGTSRDDPAIAAFNLFRGISQFAVNPELGAAIMNINERLQPVRLIEYMVVPDAEHEIAGLFECFRSKDWTLLVDHVSHYHKLRIRLVPELVTCLLYQ